MCSLIPQLPTFLLFFACLEEKNVGQWRLGMRLEVGEREPIPDSLIAYMLASFPGPRHFRLHEQLKSHRPENVASKCMYPIV